MDGDALLAGKQPDSTVYNKKNGLPHISTSNSRSYLSPEGVACLAGNDGITRINTSQREGVSGAPMIAVPFIEVDGERIWISDGDTVTIPKDALRVSIDVHVLTYAMDEASVRYQLEGFDKEHVTVSLSDLSGISYTNLDGGTYTFRIALSETKDPGEFSFTLIKEKKPLEKTGVLIAIGVLNLLLAALIVWGILRLQKKRLEARSEEERLNQELNMASSIQADLLPGQFPAFPDRSEFDVYASTVPAREVGGDFYDFFLTDSDHLALVIGDVNGRGVPAALFMTLTKTLLKSSAMAYSSPAKVLAEVNEQLSEDIEKSMFVTVWLGILEISTGKLIWADGGSREPAVFSNGTWSMLQKQSSVALYLVEPEHLKTEASPAFVDQTLHMSPGEQLFLYTDGVTESSNVQKELFGAKRLLDSLNGSPEAASPEEIISSVQKSIDAFTKDAPHSDDQTMLCMCYKGSKEV